MLLKQSTAVVRVFALSAIGLTAQIKLSKNGGALANPSAGASNLTEIGQGLYKFSLTTTDTNTAGSLSYALTDAATGLTIYTPPDCQDGVVLDLPGATISGDVTLNSLTVTTTTTLTGAVSLGSTLDVTGAVTLHSTLGAGATTFNSLTVTTTTTLTGAVSLGGALGVTGTTTLNALTVTNATTLSGALVVTGAITLTAGLPAAERNAIADALLGRANGIETGFTPKQSLEIILSAVAGKCAIAGNTVTIRDVNDAANRIVATTDSEGQRTAVTLTP